MVFNSWKVNLIQQKITVNFINNLLDIERYEIINILLIFYQI